MRREVAACDKDSMAKKKISGGIGWDRGNGRSTRRLGTPRPLIVLLVGTMLLAACGGSGDSADEETAATTDATSPSTSAPELDVIFEDDLIEDENGWGESDNEQFSTQFRGDGYAVRLVGSAPSYFAYPDDGPLVVGDSSTTVTAASEAESDSDVGVMCRLSRTGPYSFYTLTVNSVTGAYTIARWTRIEGTDTPEVLEDGVDDAIEAVGDAEPVEVTGTCSGEGDGDPVDLSLAVNGREVATATDEDGLGAGITGLSVVSFDAQHAERPAVFHGIEIRGEDADDTFAFEDDFSDPESGFEEFTSEAGTDTSRYEDGAMVFEINQSLRLEVPVRPPFPIGTATADIQGDLSQAFGGLCIGGDEGMYEFDISEGGKGSIVFFPADPYSDYVVVDEAEGAFEDSETHQVTAGWNTDGTSTNLDLYVDGEVVASGRGDDSLTAFSNVFLCSAVSSEAAADATATVTYDDLVVAE